MEDQERKIIGIEASASSDNAYYVPGCKHAQHRAPYAACLSRINDRKGGRLDTRPECSAAIGRKDCPALSMRHEETVKGEAIYFVSRVALQKELQAAAEARGQLFAKMAEHAGNWAPTGKRGGSKRKGSTVAPSAPPAASPTDYAAAINAAMAKLKTTAPLATTPPATEEQPVGETAPKVGVKLSVSADLSKPAEGMSMMDFIRMARNRTQAAPVAA